MGSYDVRAQAQ